MIQIIPSNERHYGNHGWLEARWHFSFGDYHDPKNMGFSALRVFNDDIVHGGGGFDMHPHRDMEIVTVMIEGRLRHKDSLGNEGTLQRGEVQVMSAGKGIVHAEFNDSKTEKIRLMQIWLLPQHRGNKPRYEQKAFDLAGRQAALQPVVSAGDVPGTLAIDQDATIYLASLKTGQAVTHEMKRDRKAYLFVIAGSITVNGQKLANGDQARIADEAVLQIAGTDAADVILLDLP